MLFKRDLAKAYRQIAVNPRDIRILGFLLGRYADTVISMEVRSGAYICQRITNTVAHIFQKWGLKLWFVLKTLQTVNAPNRPCKPLQYSQSC